MTPATRADTVATDGWCELGLRLLLARALVSDPRLTIIDGAIGGVSADARLEAGEILREWPGSVIVTSEDPRSIIPGSKVWCLEQSTEGARWR